jgi:hypothetical protein
MAHLASRERASLATAGAVQAEIANKAIQKANKFRKRKGKLQEKSEEIYGTRKVKGLARMLSHYKPRVFNCGSETYVLTRERLYHFLVRHHPKYWNGIPTDEQSFFHKNISVDEICSIIEEVIRQNREEIINRGITSKGFKVFGRVNGIKYQLGFYLRHIGQLFPPLKQN